MTKIENIAVLDVRDIQEEIANEISEIRNVSILIGNDRSQILLKHAKMINIAETLKLPEDKEISFIMKNGSMKIDKDYLESIIKPIFILVNGRLEIKNDVDNKLLDEKMYSLMINGELICPKNLSGIIQSKGTINGAITAYSSDYTFMGNKIEFNNKFLKSMRKDSKLSFKKLLVLEDLDEELLEDKIKNIEALNKLVITEGNQDKLVQYIEDYYSVNKYVIDSNDKVIKYIEDDTRIDSSNIKKYDDNILYVDGRLKIKLHNIDNFNKYINLIIADKIICNEKTYEIIKENIAEDIEVEIIEGEVIENTGKMTLTGIIEQEISIKNMGKLVLAENLNYDSFTKNVLSITNYGAIEVPEERMGLLQNKIKENSGIIKATKESRKEVSEQEQSEDILYSNMAELKL